MSRSPRRTSAWPHGDAARDRRLAWLVVGGALLGAADWIATWLLIGETAEGTREVAGLSEGNLRALQNLGTLLLLLALSGARRRYGARLGELGTAGFAVTAIALAVVLVGNIVEFGLWGEGPLDSQDPGAAIFFTGLLVLAFGLVLLAMSAAGTARHSPRRLEAPTRLSRTDVTETTSAVAKRKRARILLSRRMLRTSSERLECGSAHARFRRPLREPRTHE